MSRAPLEQQRIVADFMLHLRKLHTKPHRRTAAASDAQLTAQL